MNIRCPRCGETAPIAGHEDGRAYYACPSCQRVWPAPLVPLRPVGTSGGPPTRVLVADDSDAMARMLAMWLEDENCDVLTALSGRQALDLSMAHDPEIAFVDIVMPPPDGFRVCEVLKARGPTEVILMTGVAPPDAQRRASDLDAVALIKKPFTREDALALFGAALHRARRRRG